jgi:hypothetical protein
MYRQHIYSLLIALFLACPVAFAHGSFRVAPDQLFELGDKTDRIAGSHAALSLSKQPTAIARPTLDPTRMPLTNLPIATIRMELTATAQQATAQVLTPTAQPTPGSATIVPTPNHVPVVGQTSSTPGGLVLLSFALFCLIVGGVFSFLSRKYHDRS